MRGLLSATRHFTIGYIREVDMALNSGTSAANHHGRVVYYRGRHVLVTNLHVATAGEQYPVRELDQVRRVLSYRYPASAVALVVGAAELLVGFVLAAYVGMAALLGVTVLDAAGVAGAVLLDSRRNPRWMELRAVHRGREVVLFRGRDQREFEQVRRAVIRAVEAHRW
jgi:ABC-type protease/lipase transport system fused ATPase/permease subunit